MLRYGTLSCNQPMNQANDWADGTHRINRDFCAHAVADMVRVLEGLYMPPSKCLISLRAILLAVAVRLNYFDKVQSQSTRRFCR